MNTSPTPETDAFFAKYDTDTQWYAHLKEAKDFARKLERERDEARGEVARLLKANADWKVLADTDAKKVNLVSKERDQLRKVCDEQHRVMQIMSQAIHNGYDWNADVQGLTLAESHTFETYNSLPHVKERNSK